MKHLNLTIALLLLSMASFAQAVITGPTAVCIGQSVPEADVTPGGTWSGGGAYLTIGATTGIVTGVAAGVGTITYTVGVSYVTASITVEPLPSGITGASSDCVGSSITLSDAPGGGTWSSGTTAVVSIDPATGVASGLTVGVAVITYTLPTGCYTTHVVTVDPLPLAITGGSTVCAGGTLGLGDATPGGIWSSAAPAVISVSGTGLLTGVTLGTAMITYALPTGCAVATSVTVVAAPVSYSVSGGGGYCAGGTGATIDLSGSVTGVSYQVYTGGTSIGSAVPGTGGPLVFGPETIGGTYTVMAEVGTGCAAAMTGSATVVVNPLPPVFTVSGGGSYCSGGTGVTISLLASMSSYDYQLYDGSGPVGLPIIGTGGSVSFGLITGGGTYYIRATDPVTGCSDSMSGTATVIVSPLPTAYAVSTGGSYCAGGTGVDITLSNSDLGINYTLYLGGTAVTTVAGVGGLLDFGMYTIAGAYTVGGTNATTTCTNSMTGSATITVTALPTVSAAATAAACGGGYTLSASGATTYSWSPTTGLSCSTCSSATVVPASSTTYIVTGTDLSGCTNTATASVDGNRISGYISYSGTPSAGDFKVWLIQYNPSDSSITSTDSTANCVDGGTAYYQFMDEPGGNYMVKAKLNAAVPGTSGYIPTYSLSTPHWDSAATITHGSSADSMHINMVYGTVPAGPGFISGYVTSGAGRGTSPDVPAAGMLIYLKDVAGNIITYNYTAADGSYTFGSLANNTYVIYPETYKYYTTPSTVITLSPASETVSGINFKQHTTYGTITPSTSEKAVVIDPASGIMMYPNPASSVLNIQWSNQANGNGEVVIADIVGREVFRTSVDMSTSGASKVDISSLKNGVYMVTINAGQLKVNNKLTVQH